MSENALHILGIRHHGPGSARSVVAALEEIGADCVLIEGPPDADALVGDVVKAGMEPPVAILVHDVQKPADAVYYPFAVFSPEWQAMRWAVEHNVPVRFMDLPQAHRLAIVAERIEAMRREMEAAAGQEGGSDTADEAEGQTPAEAKADEQAPAEPAAAGEGDPNDGNETGMQLLMRVLQGRASHDPLQKLAQAAGFDDGERWWEHVVESRRNHGAAIFTAIREAMTELRQSRGEEEIVDPDEPLREAWMRRTIRGAIKEGYQRIAVICGAWHAPALDVEATPKKQDDELLKGLAKVKTAATWVPWTYDRLTSFNGYGAGVQSPGWYEHLWLRDGCILESWMTRVARLLRDKNIDCSSAHVIEAVRLSETLAAMRGRPLADLSDIADATRSIFCFDSDLAMTLIGRELLVGQRMGQVPEDTPMVPLQQDLLAHQKRLRLKPEAQERDLDLDLRSDVDRQRSILLHRLRLLEIDWGTPAQQHGGKGTFHERWKLRWDPGFAIRLIEAGALGNTLAEAAGARLEQLAREASDLRKLAGHLQDAMLADLGQATRELVQQIENAAAVSSDVAMLMQTLPPLASLIRYGNVRQTDQAMVRAIVDGIVPRIIAGLGGAVSSLNDEAAEAMQQHLHATHAALELLETAEHIEEWQACLLRIIGQDSVHGLVRGRSARLLLDSGRLDADAVRLHLGRTLSRGTDPAAGARWLEGFLSGSGLLLIHDTRLLKLIDDWVVEIQAEVFEELLPLLRRTFSTFPKPERRQIGQLLRTPGAAQVRGKAGGESKLNHVRAERALPVLMQLLAGEGVSGRGG